MIKLLISVPFVLIVGLAACSAEPASAPTPTALPTVQLTVQRETPEAERLLSLGHELFVSKGCAACHGQDAEGTGIAPPLAGHTSAQVKRQARAPLGIMPVFPPDKLSNDELEAIVEFIVGTVRRARPRTRTRA